MEATSSHHHHKKNHHHHHLSFSVQCSIETHHINHTISIFDHNSLWGEYERSSIVVCQYIKPSNFASFFPNHCNCMNQSKPMQCVRISKQFAMPLKISGSNWTEAQYISTIFGPFHCYVWWLHPPPNNSQQEVKIPFSLFFAHDIIFRFFAAVSSAICTAVNKLLTTRVARWTILMFSTSLWMLKYDHHK